MKTAASLYDYQPAGSSRALSVCGSKPHGINTEDDVPDFEVEPAVGDLESLEALGLTRRQAEVAFWIAQGKANDDLAIILSTSHHTIPYHVEAILARLNLATRAEIMLCALETLGWLSWPTKQRRKLIKPKR